MVILIFEIFFIIFIQKLNLISFMDMDVIAVILGTVPEVQGLDLYQFVPLIPIRTDDDVILDRMISLTDESAVKLDYSYLYISKLNPMKDKIESVQK